MRSISRSEQIIATLGSSVHAERQPGAPGLVDDGVPRIAGALEPSEDGFPKRMYGVEALQRRVHVARVAQVVQADRHALYSIVRAQSMSISHQIQKSTCRQW